jgi:hypothetical protein
LMLPVSGMGKQPDACDQQDTWPEQPPAWTETYDDRLVQVLRERWDLGPNFACSALLVTLGCGTGCVTGGIYDAASEAWQPLHFAIHAGLNQTAPLLDFAHDSRELIATGYLNEDEEGVFRFRWTGTTLEQDDAVAERDGQN